MKWLIILLLLSGAASGEISFMLLHGGDPDFNLIRNPFPVSPDLTVTISNPIDGETYLYNTFNISAIVSGGNGDYFCQYKIDNYNWNNMSSCGGQIGTLPSGTRTLTVRATDTSERSGTDSITITISVFGGGAGLGLSIWFIIVGFVIIIIPGKKKTGCDPQPSLFKSA